MTSSRTRTQQPSGASTLQVLAVILACSGLLTGVRAQPGHTERGVPVRTVSVSPACGTKFVDASSSALLADVVLKGSVDNLSQASPLAPLLYKAKVNVHKVYKGQELLTTATSDLHHHNNNSSSSSARKQPRVDVIQVERFGPTENRENCVAQVEKGQIYLFFLRVKDASSAAIVSSASLSGVSSSSSSLSSSGLSSALSSSSVQRNRNNILVEDSSSRGPLVLVNTALPAVVDLKTLRKVKKVLCPDCSSVPVIKKLRCKDCAQKPSMKRPMSANNTKTVKAGKRLTLRCVARGSPRPSYSWVKDGVLLYHQENEKEEDAERRKRRRRRQSTPSAEGRERRRTRSWEQGGDGVFRSGTLSVRSSKHHSLLVVKKVKPEDQGTYLCLASNAVGEAEQRVQVLVEEPRSRSRSTPRSRPSPSAPDLDPPVGGGDEDNDEDDGEGPCAFNPCYNGGSCYVAEDGEAEGTGRGSVRCDCLPDYHGSRCQFRRRPNLLDAAAEEGGVVVDGDDGGDAVGDGGEANLQTTTLLQPVNPNDNSNNDDNDNNSDNNNNHHRHHHHHQDARPTQPSAPLTPTLIYPLITTTSETANRGILNPQSLFPQAPLPRKPYLSKKHRRKHGSPSRGVSYGVGRGKASKSGAPQLKVSECPPGETYCFNGGTCKVVVKLQRKFCQCPRGFAGRRCERRF